MWSGFISLVGLAGQKFTTAFLLSIVAIILSVWLCTEYLRHEPRIASDNAYNIVEKAVQGVSGPIDMVLIAQKWENDGWTAQTGSLKTLCHYDRHRLEDFAPIESINTICILVR
jgi:hypothetical protein